MTTNNESKSEKQAETAATAEAPDTELTEEQLDEVAGGVAFLKGTIASESEASPQVAGSRGGPNQLAAKTGTTLGCWETYTVHISGC